MIRGNKDKIIAVVGMGYVGLPLIIELSKFYTCIGYDIDKKKISNLKNSIDLTNEIKTKNFAKNIFFTYNEKNLNKANIVILCIPTPIYKNKKPDLSLLKRATTTVAKYLSKKTIVVYESTVYPGVTEDICVPLIEKSSKLIWKRDFHVGYSPERINPGDKIYNFKNTSKIVSGDTKETLNVLAKLYGKITKVHLAESIKVAEAAKVIENAQRDINIGLINEFAIILNKLNINIHNVLEASATKWNFLRFEPGLVGGHCIGVDPYYLAYLAKKVKVKSDVILSARTVNEKMSNEIVSRIKKILKTKSKILILGVTFKENCNDIRNSKNLNLAKNLIKLNYKISINDNYLTKKDFSREKITNNYISLKKCYNERFDMVLILVKHDYICQIKVSNFYKILNKNGVLYYFKNILNKTSISKNKNIKYLNF